MAARGEVPPSRPQAPSVASARLPPVTQHPLSRLGAPESLSLRGHAPSGQEPAGGSGCTRAPPPPPPGPELRPRFRGARSPQPLPEASARADPGKPKLPVFGQRADIGNPAVSRASFINRRISLLSQPGTQLRIEADERCATHDVDQISGKVYQLQAVSATPSKT
ncbi:uncharacterized protein LOC142829638 isoform X2 [Pelodiscus sinensis]|uniref:uncharacterized protein LOC142829638 isoform X2 n=1 Tax=Pelodiscus sinensis TaxID=13735 RepID=UPI003F6B8A4A